MWEPGLFGCSPSLAWMEGGDLGLPTGQGTLAALRTREGEGGGEGKGKGRWGGGGNF